GQDHPAREARSRNRRRPLMRESILSPVAQPMDSDAQLSVDQGFTSKITSSSTGEPSGRLATPKTRREEMASSPETSRNSSDAASATFGCSVKSGVAAM